jgi:hypothetical protein
MMILLLLLYAVETNIRILEKASDNGTVWEKDYGGDYWRSE